MNMFNIAQSNMELLLHLVLSEKVQQFVLIDIIEVEVELEFCL